MAERLKVMADTKPLTPKQEILAGYSDAALAVGEETFPRFQSVHDLTIKVLSFNVPGFRVGGFARAVRELMVAVLREQHLGEPDDLGEFCEDAGRRLVASDWRGLIAGGNGGIPDGYVIVQSPPSVTAYEVEDTHQCPVWKICWYTALWETLQEDYGIRFEVIAVDRYGVNRTNLPLEDWSKAELVLCGAKDTRG